MRQPLSARPEGYPVASPTGEASLDRTSFLAKQKFDVKLWGGLAVSLFFLVLLFRKIDPDKLAEAFRRMDWRYLVPAVLLTFASYYLRALRWRCLLAPIQRTGMGNLLCSTLIGYMANNLLPARLGELVRAYSLAQKERLDTGTVFATLVVDRLCDGFTVLVVLLVTFFTLRLPPAMEAVQNGLVTGGYVTLALYLAVVLFLLFLKTQTQHTLGFLYFLLTPFPERIAIKLSGWLNSFISGIKLSRDPATLFGIVLSSLVIWAAAIWPIDLVLRSFGIVLPITASMFIMVFLVFAVMVPASPGYVGTYHFACVTALSAFGISGEKALSVALVIHGLSFFPVIAVGLLLLWKDKLSLGRLAHESEAHGN